MIREGDRRARHLRYKALDPDCRWQPMGYDYMLQEDGLRQVIEGHTSIQELLRVCK